MEKLKLPEILERLKAKGLGISKRTFEFYQSLGFLPKPEKKVGKGGRGVYGYYDPSVVDPLVKTIHDLKSRGYSLLQIMEIAESSVIKRYKSVLKQWGFSDYMLSELKGRDPSKPEVVAAQHRVDIMIREGILEAAEKSGIKLRNKRDKDAFVKVEMPERYFERRMLKRLKWWDCDEAVELDALQYISNEAESVHVGLISAMMIATDHIETDDDVATKILRAMAKRTDELRVLEAKVNGRIAELIGGEYKSRAKEGWAHYQKIWEETPKKSIGQ